MTATENVQYEHSLIVGVDVGGTYTDAVCLCGDRILGVTKEQTTEDVTCGVQNALASLVKTLRAEGHQTNFRQVNIGTTHFINAVIQRRRLTAVSILRLCGTASRAIDPCMDFPEELKQAVFDSYYFLNGGFEFDGKPITPLDVNEVVKCVDDIRSRSITNIVVSCVFAPVNGVQEKEVEKIIRQHFPDASVTLSHEVGQMGLLERENAAILNESLKPLCRETINAFTQALDKLDIRCPFFMTQNDGTIISSELALEFPVHTFSSGPTNSMRGAAHLSGVLDNAVVVDIGGTSTDVGFLMKGFPREASSRSYKLGVSTNFRMPDVHSIGLGGGSLVKYETKDDIVGSMSVGPDSVGYRLLKEALIFGGHVLTATDVAVSAGLVELDGDTETVKQLPVPVVRGAVDKIHEMLEDVIDQMKVSGEDIPVIIVGGGSILIDETRGLRGASQLIKPPHYKSANAIGAALSQVSGTVDYVANVTTMSREEAIQQAEEKARQAAIQNGADESTLEITERDMVGLTYLPGNVIRIKVKAVGKLAITQLAHARPSSTTVGVGSDPESAPRENAEKEQVKESSQQAQDERGIHGTQDETPTKDVKDKDADYQPHIDSETGEWILTERDIEYISIGAGLLGSGGGGSPQLGKLRALKHLRNGKRIRVITPERLDTTPDLKGKVFTVAFMGAPAVLIEKLMSGTEIARALACTRDVLAANYDDVCKQASLSDDNDDEDSGLIYIDNYKLCSDQSPNSRDKVAAIMSGEIGGLNSMEPLVAGADLDVPVVDCDGMGRAFPELQMLLPAIHGKPMHPCALVSDGTQQAVIVEAKTQLQVEQCFRKVVAMNMGCSGALVISPLNKQELLSSTVQYSISRAWNLGRMVKTAHSKGISPVSAVIQSENGLLLINGKITDVTRQTTGGFDKGSIKVQGSAEFAGSTLVVEFQNENLLAKRLTNVDGTEQESIVATTPDLIVVADADKGQPIPTEDVRYGVRVAVIALPSPPVLRTPQALKVVGPRAFNYDTDFVPIREYLPPTPVPPMP